MAAAGALHVHFRLVAATTGVAAAAFLLAGRPLTGLALCIVAVLAIAARHWFLWRMDVELVGRDAGDPAALPRLRRLHWAGMAYNAVQFGLIVSNVPRMLPAAV